MYKINALKYQFMYLKEKFSRNPALPEDTGKRYFIRHLKKKENNQLSKEAHVYTCTLNPRVFHFEQPLHPPLRKLTHVLLKI